MVQLNKYLRELNIDEKYGLFDKKQQKIDDRYKSDEDGFVNAETFNLDMTLSMIIYSYLCYFREHCLVGHPAFMTFEEGKLTIDKMIEAFKLYIETDNEMEISKNKKKKINYGMKLFIKYYNHLWG